MYKAKDYFSVVINIPAIAPGATQTASAQLDVDADFMWQKAMYFSHIAGAAQTESTRVVPLLLVTIEDGGTSRQLSKSAVPIAAIFGTGELPFILTQPKLFSAGSAITVKVENFSVDTTYTTRLVFNGVKCFH